MSQTIERLPRQSYVLIKYHLYCDRAFGSAIFKMEETPFETETNRLTKAEICKFQRAFNLFDKDGDGKIRKIDKEGNISSFATGLYDPKGIVFYKENSI